MSFNAKKIGFRVQKLRKNLGLTQAELAERANLDTVYVSQVERGQRTMSLPTLFTVASALQVEPETVIETEEKQDDDQLVKEIREVLSGLDEEQVMALLGAIRLLKKI